MNNKLEQAVAWIIRQAGCVEYGNITLTIIRHGKTTRLEKTVTEKVQVNGGSTNGTTKDV